MPRFPFGSFVRTYSFGAYSFQSLMRILCSGSVETDGGEDSRTNNHNDGPMNKEAIPDSGGQTKEYPTGGENTTSVGTGGGGASGNGHDGGDGGDDQKKKELDKGQDKETGEDDSKEEVEDEDDGDDGKVRLTGGKRCADIDDAAMYEPPPRSLKHLLRTSRTQNQGKLTKLEMWQIKNGLGGEASGGSSSTSWTESDPPKWSSTSFHISGSPPQPASGTFDELLLEDLTDEENGDMDITSHPSVQWTEELLKDSSDSSTGGGKKK